LLAIREFFQDFTFFYSYLGYRIPLFLALGILVAFLDGFGLAMFLPLLKMMADTDGAESGLDLGNFQGVIDFMAGIGLELNLTVIMLLMLGFFSVKGFVKFIESYVSAENQRQFVIQIRKQNIWGLVHYRFDQFVTADAGQIQNTMSGEVYRVASAFRSYMGILQQLFMVSVYTFLAFLMNPQFAVFVLFGAALTNVLFNRMFTITKKLSKKITLENQGYQGLLIQQVAFFKYLKATGLVVVYAEKLIEKIIEIESAQKRLGVMGSWVQGGREPLLILILVVAILLQVNWFGGSLALILLSILFFYRALTSVTQLQMSHNQFLANSASLENVQNFNSKLRKGAEITGKMRIDQFRDCIELRGVTYGYDSKVNVLSDISFVIKKNESIAFVGESGAGKTTLMNIVAGLLQPQHGTLVIDGIESSEIDMVTYRSKIGYITQEPVIFDDNIFNNVTFWDVRTPDTISRMWKALEMANLNLFVEQLALKEESRLGNNGINLSGGQRQRIAIARELYKEVEILFMDEATSSLDSETEHVIQENIEMLKGKLTIVIIAHRMSTIKGVDRIVVLKAGRVEAIGSNAELIQKSESFRAMVFMQNSYDY
jgi:ABC-type multidrug transport system fused ATPase/permease subunit